MADKDSLAHKIRHLIIRHRNAYTDQKGQSLVELALVLPILISVLVGSVEITRVVHCAIEVSNAANAGASYGAQNPFTAADVTGMQNAALADGADLVSWGASSFTATAVKNCTCTDGTTITCANASTMCVSPGRILVDVKVNTTGTLDSLFDRTGFAKQYTLRGQAIMRVAQ